MFTDGAYEPDGQIKASIGGVLVNDMGYVAECFGVEIPETLRHELLVDSKHPIYELEILPVLVALRLWQQLICWVAKLFSILTTMRREVL